MLNNKIITSIVLAAVCMNVALPATAGYYQTVYVPNNQAYGASGQTVIVQGEMPTQTVIVRDTTPNTVVVRETVPEPAYIPQTAYVSNESLVAAGFTGLLGGVLLGSALKHHKKKSHVAPMPPKPAPYRPAPVRGGGHHHGHNGHKR